MDLAAFKRAQDEQLTRAMALVEELNAVSSRMEAGETGPGLDAEKWRIAAAMNANAAEMERLNADFRAAGRRRGRRTIVLLVVAILVSAATFVLGR